MEPIEITFEGDAQVYRLSWDFNELCEAEALLGLNLFGGAMATALQTRGFLYACLKKAHPVVTVAEAGGLLNKGENAKVLGALTQLLRSADGTAAVPEMPAAERAEDPSNPSS